MSDLAGTVNAARGRGRPSLNVKETKVRLTDDQRTRIEALVGKSRMAQFIREAIDGELRRRERQRKPPQDTQHRQP